MPPAIPRRSALYVPGSNSRALEKAAGLDADVLIFDLEDSVAPAAKAVARTQVAEWLARHASDRGQEFVVRINQLDNGKGHHDIAALAGSAPHALLLPKVSTAMDIQRARAALEGSPLAGRVRLWAMIETPRAVLDPLGIALAVEAVPELEAFVLGLNDLSLETGTRQVPGRAPMLPWMMNALAAARVAGLAILDGVYGNLSDLAGFGVECAEARDCGFDGKTIIHPAQVGPCNAAFSPGEAELAEARRIVDGFAAAQEAGQGVVAVDGRMVEALHAELAQRKLDLAAAISRRALTKA